MGVCTSFCHKRYYTTPFYSKHKHARNVLSFVYHVIFRIQPRWNCQYAYSFHNGGRSWKCLNCNMHETNNDFIIKFEQDVINLSFPLCHYCHKPGVLPYRIYDSNDFQFYDIERVHIIRDILQLIKEQTAITQPIQMVIVF